MTVSRFSIVFYASIEEAFCIFKLTFPRKPFRIKDIVCVRSISIKSKGS